MKRPVRLLSWTRRYGRALTILLGVPLIIIIISLVSHLWMRADAKKVSDLYYIQGAVDSYYLSHGTVPKDLSVLHLGNVSSRLEGFKGQASDYTYKPGSGGAIIQDYELCAVFSGTVTAPDDGTAYFGSYHRGKTCYQLDSYQDQTAEGRYSGTLDPRYQGPQSRR